MFRLDVFATPDVVPADGQYDVSLCIDVLRATTTMITALANGAEKIIPFLTIEEAQEAKKQMLNADPVLANSLLLGGERQGVLIKGFDLGNSPEHYSPSVITGKTILFTTTNGTKAVQRGIGKVYPVSFLNAEAVVRSFIEQSGNIAIVCAGTDGECTEEDFLLAGYLTEMILLLSKRQRLQAIPIEYHSNVQAEAVLNLWQNNFSLRPDLKGTGDHRFVIELTKFLRQSRGGSNLIPLGFGKDIADAARINTISLVAEYTNGVITLK